MRQGERSRFLKIWLVSGRWVRGLLAGFRADGTQARAKVPDFGRFRTKPVEKIHNFGRISGRISHKLGTAAAGTDQAPTQFRAAGI